MLKKSKIKQVIIFTFILIITTDCKLMFPIDEKSNNNDKEEENKIPIPIPSVQQLYNEDGTEFKGNGKIYIYCDNGEDAREFYYSDVINGIKVYNDNNVKSYEAFRDFFMSWIDNPPSFSVIPTDYVSSDISIEIVNVDNKVNCSASQGSFWGYRFYYDNKPDEYKLVEYMRESKDENGNIKRLFLENGQRFCFVYPEEGYRFIEGELNYTQILTDLHSGKTEIADVKVIYDLDFGYFGEDRKTTSPFYFIYTKAVYTILEEDSNNIHYKADITIGFREKLSAEDYNIGKPKDTLHDKYFRFRK